MSTGTATRRPTSDPTPSVIGVLVIAAILGLGFMSHIGSSKSERTPTPHRPTASANDQPLTLIAVWRAEHQLTPRSTYPDDDPAETVRIEWNVMGRSGSIRPKSDQVGPTPSLREWTTSMTFANYDGSPATMRVTLLHQPDRRVQCQMKVGQDRIDIGEDLQTVMCSIPPPKDRN